MQPATQVSDRTNDFAIIVGTVNGSGSQTANLTLLRAIFKMGIPVSAKNLFPSNISGLPTWYILRVSRDGYTARPERPDILVAFNPQTAAEDAAALPAGGVCLYPADGAWKPQRDDIIAYGLPVKELAASVDVDPKMRDYMANMVYVGALATLLGIDLDEIRAALLNQFKGKTRPVELNFTVVARAAAWARDNLEKRDPFRVQPMNRTDGMILVDGNTAGALGAIFGGVSVVAWYPITPATSLADALSKYLPRLRTDPQTGRATYAIVQAEDEIAALGMVVGAGWSGARAMTSTSGPGISLMTEFTGLSYFAEIPAVIWDIQRVGPSTGLPTRTSQGDVLKVYYLGHGDTRHVCLLPGSVAECFEFGYRAFDLAERLQTPVFVLSDLDLGMNLWMSEPFEYPEQPMDRGKVLSAEDLERMKGFARFRDLDGDGIGYRTLPGTPHPLAATLTRGTGHNEVNAYSERPADWHANMQRLARKHATARTLVPKPVVAMNPEARVGIIAYGSTEPAIIEARDILQRQGVPTSFLRVRALPLEQTTRDFVAQHELVYVVEMNQDGQMHQLIQLHCPDAAARLHSIGHCDGLPLSAQFVAHAIAERLLVETHGAD